MASVARPDSNTELVVAGYLAAALMLLLLGLPGAGQCAEYSGIVVRVLDGDTLVVLDADRAQHRVRLAGIDAPEKRQGFGEVSRQHLAALVFGKSVVVQTGKDDRYGREIGKVIVARQDVNLAQIQEGLAWHYKKYASEQSPVDRLAYAQAETESRLARRGLWRDANALPPWDYRHHKPHR